ncbi:MAG: flagellar hook protein FlgE [Ignavibacteriaceae bacterium]
MALLNSLFAGVSGMRNHQSMMDVIGNNIANVNTIGFKGSRITFSDAFNQFVKAGTNPTASTGGTNTFQVGLGMKINSIDRNWNQGTFERTGITTDMALQGPGMFVLKSNEERFYSRAGAFIFDADGKLVSPQNGAIVQGKVANSDGAVPPGNNLEDIVIDTNLKLPAIATDLIKWGGNLKSNSELTRSDNVVQRGNLNSNFEAPATAPGPFDTQTAIYNELGEKYILKVTYTATATPNEYDMTWRVLDEEGEPFLLDPTDPLSIDPAYDGALPNPILFIENPPSSGNFVLDDTSKAYFDSDSTDDNHVTVPGFDAGFDIEAGSITQNGSTTTLSLSADGNREPNIVSGSVTIFDSLGTSHQVTMKYTKILDNTWIWSASIPGISTDNGLAVDSTGTITFNSDGTLDPSKIAPNNPQLTFTPAGGANLMVIDLDFGRGFGGVTQTSSSSVISALNQNGSASASLSNINIDQYGHIVGIFSNGNSRTLAQVMVATFANLNGLISVGDNLFSSYANSGDPRIASLGEESGTTVQSGALEQSNVDLSEEFTKMIVSQRGFQANARVISTADTLLQEITNLIR